MRSPRWKSALLRSLLASAGSLALGVSLAHGQILPHRRPCPPPPWPAPSATESAAPATPAAEPLKPPAEAPKAPPAAEPAPMIPEPTTAPESSLASGGERVALFDSSVGYIDNAIPGTQLRLRMDAAYNARRPTRAEFIYARTGPAARGLEMSERSIDYQDITAYLEYAPNANWSVFVESGARFLNPDLNDNSAGMGDMNAGFKMVVARCDEAVASFQFKTYLETGDATRGLGTDHVSLEPGLLLYKKLADRWALEGELKYWIPIEGTPGFAGDVARYGVGLHYDLYRSCDLRITPVAEFVGWTVFNGQKRGLFPAMPITEDADGDTIVNAKVGLRLGVGQLGDIYAGYGRSLTGQNWYEDIYRLEFRLRF